MVDTKAHSLFIAMDCLQVVCNVLWLVPLEMCMCAGPFFFVLSYNNIVIVLRAVWCWVVKQFLANFKNNLCNQIHIYEIRTPRYICGGKQTFLLTNCHHGLMKPFDFLPSDVTCNCTQCGTVICVIGVVL